METTSTQTGTLGPGVKGGNGPKITTETPTQETVIEPVQEEAQ